LPFAAHASGYEATQSALIILVEDVCELTEEGCMFFGDAVLQDGAEIKG
jgi:hypothetical protein